MEFSVKNYFSQEKWSTYCKYFFLWQIRGMCGGHTLLITSHQWPSLLAAPSHPTALCVTNDKNTQWTKGLQIILLMLKNLVLNVLLGTGRTWTIKRLSPLPVAANFGKLVHCTSSDVLSARTNLSAQLVQVYTVAWFWAPYIPNFVYVLGTNLRFGFEQEEHE